VSEQILNGTSAQLGYIQCHSRSKIQDRRQIENKHYKNYTKPRKSKQRKIQQNKTSLV